MPLDFVKIITTNMIIVIAWHDSQALCSSLLKPSLNDEEEPKTVPRLDS
jgi:hypothetical protein